MHLNGFNNQFLGIISYLELHFNCCYFTYDITMQPFDVIFRLPWRRARVCVFGVPLALEWPTRSSSPLKIYLFLNTPAVYVTIYTHADNLLQRRKINIVERRLISHSCTLGQLFHSRRLKVLDRMKINENITHIFQSERVIHADAKNVIHQQTFMGFTLSLTHLSLSAQIPFSRRKTDKRKTMT